jgi:hypothetical protein
LAFKLQTPGNNPEESIRHVNGCFIHRLLALYVEGKINNMLVTMETEKVVQLVPFKQTPYACVLIGYTVFTRTLNYIHSVQKNTAEKHRPKK